MDEWEAYIREQEENRRRRKELRFAAEADHIWSLVIFPFLLPMLLICKLWKRVRG